VEKQVSKLIILEWLATFILIIGVALTAYNIYPMNIYLGFFGNMLWAIIAICWRKWSLLTVQVIITVLYIAGIMHS